MKKVMLNKETGQRKVVKVGFSWTTLFFGLFVPIIRGDLLFALAMGIVGALTMGISWLVFPFFYNKMYISRLEDKGYRFLDEGEI